MRRRIISSLTMLGLALMLVSCSKDEGAKPLFDFGKAKYKEPFVGLLKGKPSFLVKSLKYPPFSWCASDTVCLQKDLVISFNEDCIRSRSEALIQIRDSLFAPLSGVEIYCNDEYAPNGDFRIKADSLEKQVTLKYVISPELGDTALQGNIYVQGIELDAVNGEMLQQDNNVVATWECRQVIGWPLMLWLLWLVVAALVFALIFYFLRWSYYAASTSSGITHVRTEISARPKTRKKEKKGKGKRGQYEFRPWVGKKYSEGIHGHKIMVLGESQYFEHLVDAKPDVTRDIISDLLNPQSEHEPYKNTYTKFERALAGKELTYEEKEVLWNSVIFYNYVQVPISGARISPSYDDFRSSEDAFFKVLNEYQPDIIIAWGKRLYDNLPQREGHMMPSFVTKTGEAIEIWSYITSSGKVVPVLPIKHPSTGFSWEYWHEVIMDFLNR